MNIENNFIVLLSKVGGFRDLSAIVPNLPKEETWPDRRRSLSFLT